MIPPLAAIVRSSALGSRRLVQVRLVEPTKFRVAVLGGDSRDIAREQDFVECRGATARHGTAERSAPRSERKASGLGAAPKMAQGMETVQPEIGLALALSTPEMICHLGWTSEDPNLQTDSHEPACQGRSVMVEPRRSGSGSPKMCWPQLALPLVIAGWVGRRGRGGCPHVTPWAASNGSSRRIGRHWPRCRRT